MKNSFPSQENEKELLKEGFVLVCSYRGNKVFCKDAATSFQIQEPLVRFADGTLISLEKSGVIHAGPKYLDGTIRLLFKPVLKGNEILPSMPTFSGTVLVGMIKK